MDEGPAPILSLGMKKRVLSQKLRGGAEEKMMKNELLSFVLCLLNTLVSFTTSFQDDFFQPLLFLLTFLFLHVFFITLF